MFGEWVEELERISHFAWGLFSRMDTVQVLTAWWWFVCVGVTSKSALSPWVIAPVSLLNIKNKCTGEKPCLFLRWSIIFRPVFRTCGNWWPWGLWVSSHPPCLRLSGMETLNFWPGSQVQPAAWSLGGHRSGHRRLSTESSFLPEGYSGNSSRQRI